VFRKVIVSRGVRWNHPWGGPRRRGLLHDLAVDAHALPPNSRPETEAGSPRAGRFGAVVAGLVAVLFLVTGELAMPGMVELAIAALLLGFGLAAVHPRVWKEPLPRSTPARPPYLDAQEQVRRHVRLLERRRQRCLETLDEVVRCAAVEREACRTTERLDSAATALSAAVAAFSAGIAREEAAGLALRVTRWMDRLPSLVEGLSRLDLGAYRHRMDRLEDAAREAETLAAELDQHPRAAEETARRARALLDAGREELARLRVELLAYQSALLTRSEAPVHEASPARAEVERAIARCWDWLCRNDARRELDLWAATAPLAPVDLPDPVRLVLPRGRDYSMLPFSLVLLGFTSAHATLAVGDIATSAPLLLLPMGAFYALFLVPGVLLFREAVRARRHEELTLCGASVILRWRWWLWSGTETVVVDPEEPVRRDEVGRVDSHPIHRLCLRGVDGRKLHFAFGLTESQHARIIGQMGRKAAPALPADGPSRPDGLARTGEGDGGNEAELWRPPLL
jgi:hypothetical protein